MQDDHTGADGSAASDRLTPQAVSDDGAARQRRVGAIDGVTEFIGMRWDDPRTVRLRIRPELINAGGLLSGVATYAPVDYCMGSTLWVQTSAEEAIATISISVNYIQTAVEGDVICRTTLLSAAKVSIGTLTALASIAASKSWFAFMMNAFHPLNSGRLRRQLWQRPAALPEADCARCRF